MTLIILRIPLTLDVVYEDETYNKAMTSSHTTQIFFVLRTEMSPNISLMKKKQGKISFCFQSFNIRVSVKETIRLLLTLL